MAEENKQQKEQDLQQSINQVDHDQQSSQNVSSKFAQQSNEFSNLKMNDILDFDSNNQINIDKSEFKLKDILNMQKKKKEAIQQLQDKLMKETIQLDLHKKKVPNSSSQSLSTNQQEQGIASKTTEKTDEMLYKKLSKKWGLDKIDETDEEKAFMKDLLDKDTKINPESLFNKSNLPQSEKEAREKFITQHNYQPMKRKNITEYNSRYSHEIDPMMQGSPLDIKNDENPKIMRYMDEFREFRPQINIGERWGQIIQQSTISRIQYEQQIAKGGNLVSYMAKTGKLGIDLYFIIFGITAAFIIPYMVYQHQKQKINYVQKTKNINPKTVPDFYYSEYDLDEISVQKSFYNQYTDEIMEEKNKKLKMHKEIQQLTNMLFSNK
ncbi:hypothetical protein ABPG72_019245 [Tetrahymena utriculariae]